MRTNINQNTQHRKMKQENNILTKSDILKKECPSAKTLNATEAGLFSSIEYKHLSLCDNNTIIHYKNKQRFEPDGNCLAHANADRNDISFEYLNIIDTSNFTGVTIGLSGDDYNMSPVHPCDGLVLNKNIRSVESLSHTQNILVIDKKDYDPYACITLESNDIVTLMNFDNNQLCLKEENNTDTTKQEERDIPNPRGCKEQGTADIHIYDRKNDEFLLNLRSVDKDTRPILKVVNGNNIEVINPLNCNQPFENKPIDNQIHQNYLPFVLAPLAVAACLGIGIKRKAIREFIQNIRQTSNQTEVGHQEREIELSNVSNAQIA